MTIAIPAIVDTQLTALRTSMQPKTDGANQSYVVAPAVLGNRAGDILELLTNLIDATGLAVTGIHGAADVANAVATADATDLTSAEALANALKAAYNAHRILTAGSVHGAADSTNVVTAAAATDEPTTVALANDIRTQLIAHQARIASATHGVADPAVVTLTACTNTATAISLLNQEKAIYNAHIANINGLSTGAVARLGGFTTANALVGTKVTFTGNVTADLAGKSAYVISSTTGVLTFAPGSLPAVPKTGDLFAVEFTLIDKDLVAMKGGKGMGDSASNPYGPGPSMINALMMLIGQLGGAVPSYLNAAAAQPFGIGSPHAANPSTRGTAALMLFAEALLTARNTVAAYTKPA